MKKSLLFVDDDPFILDALRRQLRRYRKEWDTEFAASGSAALELMAEHCFDIVVSDMRMPEMDGAEFLTHVMKQHPRTVRIILSGQSEREVRFQTLAPAHQYLSKPCDLEALRDVIQYASQLRAYLPNEELCSVVSRIAALPALQSSAAALREECAGDEPSLDRIAHIVATDPCLSAEVLQLANSPFFGVPGSAIEPKAAVHSLSKELIEQLLERSTEMEGDVAWPAGFSPEELAVFSVDIANRARNWVLDHDGDTQSADAAWTAGLLHDIGQIVLAVSLPDLFEQLLTKAGAEGKARREVEQEELGTTHAQIGGYLLRMWRLPEAIVDAVTYHHSSEAIAGETSALTALREATRSAASGNLQESV